MDGSFPVASFFSSLQGAALVSLPYEGIWKIKALPRVLAFSWFAILGCVLMMDNLWKRKVIVVNGCPIVLKRCLSYCIKEAESMVHLLVNCSFTHLGSA